MKLTKKRIKQIYKTLDGVTPLDYDCGKLCGEVCCVYDSREYPNEDLAIYLLPGEELLFKNDDCFEIDYISSREIKYPFSWDKVYYLRCVNPPHCNRRLRPIQCRTFPLIPHLTKDDEFHLIFDESEFPYKCPIIEDDLKLNDDFIQVTFKVWKLLLKNRFVYDLVAMDSRLRDNRKTDYEIVI